MNAIERIAEFERFGSVLGLDRIRTLLSRLVAAVAICVFLQAPENALRIENFRQCRPNGTILREILSIGVPENF